MEGYRWKNLFYGIFLGAWVILSLPLPSFSQGPGEAAADFAVQKIEVTKTETGPRVAIEGSKSFEYTVFRLSDPLRVVIDLPRAQLGRLAGPMEVRDGTIGVIQNRQIDDPKKRGARIEIGLDQLVEYDVVSEGNALYLNFGKPAIPLPQAAVKTAEAKESEKKEAPPPAAPLKKARSLRQVDISARADWVKVDLRGDGAIPDYKSFQLSRPTRLVVDLPRMTNATGKRNIDVGSPLLKDIRIGRHPDKTRVVFTFPEAKVPPHQLTREGAEVKLVLGEVKAEPPKEKVPVAEPPKPVQVAEAPGPKAEVQVKEEAAPPAAEKPAVPAMKEEKAPPEEPKLPEPGKAAAGIYKGTKISLDFKDADIHNIFRLIAEVSNLNVITSEDVKGKITIRLVNVPWDQALDVILATKNLIKIEEGNVLRITTIETLRKEREERQKEEEALLKTRDTKLKLEEPGRKMIKVNFSDVMDLQKLIMEKGKEGRSLLSPQGTIKADKRTGTLIVQDVRSNLEEIEQLVKELDTPTPQVLIEARVVQASITFGRSLGVQWGGSYNQTPGSKWHWGMTGGNTSSAVGWGYSYDATTGTTTPLSMPGNFVVNYPAATSAGNIPITPGGMGISFGKLGTSLVNLDLRLSLGETEGSTRVIARPKLSTLDNIKAHIQQGEKIPYETTSQAGTQVQFIDAVLKLEVTPHVTPDGNIKMTVKVNRDSRGSFRTQVNQVPSIDTREASTEVLVKNGETLVIGGIYETTNTENTSGIPWLMRIPVLGWLFKNNDMSMEKKELLIFITPTVIEKKAEI
jgi:type IV pilus assembly protein PilQ